MRILFLAPHPFMADRGTPIAVGEALSVLSDLGHTVDVVTYHAGDGFEVKNVALHRIDRPRSVKKVPIGPSWQKAVCDVHLYRLAKGLLKQHTYDVIHAVEESAFMALRLGRKFDVPFVYDMDSQMSRQIREKSHWLAPAAFVFNRLERRTVRHACGVLAVCPELVDLTRRMDPNANVHLLPDVPLGIEPSKGEAGADAAAVTDSDPSTAVGTVPNTESNHKSPLPDDILRPGGVKLMYVGNLEHYQGAGLMIDAFAQLGEIDASLVLVGGQPEHIARYRAQAESLGCGARIRFAGPVAVSRLGEVLSFADVLVSPRTAGQNTPMKIYSYLEAGKPVLATALTTHTQVLTPDVAELVAPEAAAMARGMAALINDAPRRESIGTAGQAYVRREFSPTRFRERLQHFYESLIQDHPRHGASDSQRSRNSTDNASETEGVQYDAAPPSGRMETAA